MESVLVNTTQKTELVNRKEGRKEISTKTSILLGLLIGTRRSAIGHSFFFLPPVTVLACVANSLNPRYDRMYRVLYLGLE